MRAGRLRHVIELQRVSAGTDSHGDQIDVWTTYATVRADVEALGGREFLAAEHVQSDVSVRITLRAIPGVTVRATDRVLFGSRQLDVRHAIDMAGRNRELQLLCTERVL